MPRSGTTFCLGHVLLQDQQIEYSKGNSNQPALSSQ